MAKHKMNVYPIQEGWKINSGVQQKPMKRENMSMDNGAFAPQSAFKLLKKLPNLKVQQLSQQKRMDGKVKLNT